MKLEFTVVLDEISLNRNTGNGSPAADGSPNEADRKRMRWPYHSKTFKAELSFAAKNPMQAIGNALRGQESENSQEALRVLDIILRQHAAKYIYNVHDKVKDKAFELEMSWVCDESNHLHQKVPEELLEQAITIAKAVLEEMDAD